MAQTDIDELLNSIKAENEVNCEKFAKAFAEIIARLENMASGAEAEELLKESLLEMRVELESRHRFVIERLEAVKDSFEVLNEKQDLLTKNSDLKIMFNILNENIDHFIQEAAEQKSMLDTLGVNLSEFRNDASKKDEIIEKVAIVKDGVDDVKRGLESSIMEVNSSLRNITKTLMTMDVTDQNDIIKRELENIYLATNAILSSLEIADQKNDDIAKSIVTKEDLINFSGKMDNSFAVVSEKFASIEGNERIIEEIEKNRHELKTVSDTISSELNGYLNSFKAVLSDCLEDISKNQPVVSEESDLTVIKRFEILDNLSKEIKAVEASLNSHGENSSLLLNTKFAELEDVIKDFKIHVSSNNTDSIGELSSKIDNLDSEIKQMPEVVSEKLDKWQDVINKTIESVSDIASFGDYKVSESMSAISELKSSFELLAADFASANSANKCQLDNFEEKSSGDFSELKSAFCKLSENIDNFKNNLESSAIENKERLSELSGETAEKIKVMLENLNNDGVQNGLGDLKTQINEIVVGFEGLKALFAQVSAENVQKILASIETKAEEEGKILQKIANVMDHNFQYISRNLDMSISDNKQSFEDLNSKVNLVSSSNTEKIVSKLEKIEASALEYKQNIEGLSSKIEHMAPPASDGEIVSKLEELEASALEQNHNLLGLKTKLDEFTASGADKLVSKFNNLEAKIDMANVDIATELDTNSDMVKEFIDEYRHDSVKSSEEILTLSENIKNMELELVENSTKFNTALNSQLEDLNNFVLSLKDICEKNDKMDFAAEHAEKLLAVENILNSMREKFGEDLSALQDKVADYSKAVADISLETKGKLGLSLEEIHSVKTELANVFEKITQGSDEFSTKFGSIANIIFEKFDSLSEGVESIKANADSATDLDSVIRSNLLNIEDKFVELQGLLNENFDKNSQKSNEYNSDILGKLDDLKQEIGLINTDLSDIISTKADALIDSFIPLKELIDSFMENEFDKLVENIKSQVELAYLNFSSDVNESLAENHDNYVHLEEAYKVLVDKFSSVQDIIRDLNENQIGLMVETIKEIDKTQSDNFERTNSLIELWQTELGEKDEKLNLRLTALEGSLKRGFLEQKAGAESNKNELKSAIETLLKKDEFEASALENSESIKALISENSSDLKSEISGSFLEIKSDFSAESEKSGAAINDLKTVMDDLIKKSDDFANTTQAQHLEELANSLNEKIDVMVMSDNSEAVQNMLEELNEKIDILAMSDNENRFDELEETLTGLHQKIDVLVMSDDDVKFEELEQNLNELHEKVDVLAKTDEANHIEDLVQTLHNKVDIIAATDDAELFNEIQGIKNLIDEQRKQIEDFGSEGSDLDKRLQSLLSEISNIDLEKSASDIKDAVMNSVLAVTEQITFAQETEEIKGFVEERTEEINKNLLDVKKQLCSIASGSDVWDYSYTMQDIESDIAKLRLILNDISASSSKEDLNEISKNMHKLASSVNTLHSTLTEEQINELKDNVVKINEDVLSLSSRTNKLLLNSDESHKALIDGLEELNRVLSVFGTAPVSEVLEKKLDNINAAITTSVNSDNVMREVMLYLGEWIDDASEKINTIAADTANLSSINSELCYLKSMIGNADIIEAIRKKFEVQQSRIDTLEAKLDKVMDILDRGNPEILENKIDSFEAKEDLFMQKMDLFDKKIDSFDKKIRGIDDKLGSLSQGIEKLASYVDED